MTTSPLVASAIPVALQRAQFTLIPYSTEIARELGLELTNNHSVLRQGIARFLGDTPDRVGYLEVRYISTNDGISRLSNPAVLEIGAGFSSRGLDYARNGIFYVETDLPELIQRKRRLVEDILQSEGSEPQPNHHFFELDIRCLDDFVEVGKSLFQSCVSPIAVIHEGLFEYLTPEEKITARNNIRYFLETFSPTGAWITPDFAYHQKNEPAYMKLRRGLFGIKTGNYPTYFDNHSDVEQFLREGGLQGELLPNDHLLDTLTCIERGIDPRRVKHLAEQYRAYCITLR